MTTNTPPSPPKSTSSPQSSTEQAQPSQTRPSPASSPSYVQPVYHFIAQSSPHAIQTAPLTGPSSDQQHQSNVPLLSFDSQLSPYGISTMQHVPSTPPSPVPTRRVSWLALLILPARVAAAALSFVAGAAFTRRPPRHPLALLSGAMGAAASHLLISAALAHHERRIDAEREAAAQADQERVQWLDAIQAVGKIIDRFSHGLVGPRSIPSVFLDASIARVLHAAIHRRRLRLSRNRARTRTDVLVQARRMCDFAMAAYGFVLLRMLNLVHLDYNPAVEGMRAEDVARFMLRIPASDIILSRLDGEAITVPRHYVALDRRSSSIVVSIRGTNSISDILTDLICENEPFAGGYAHAGMKTAAETLRDALLPTLRSLLSKYPRYRIVITGHSMGAGVAILLTKLLAEQGFNFVKCFAFAPCPVFGPMHRVDSEWSDALECFVHADDLVARLCLSSARRLALEMEQVGNIGLSINEKKAVIKHRSAAVVEELLRKNRRAAPRDPREKEVEQLYIPTHRGIHWLIAEEEEDGDESDDEATELAVLREGSDSSEEEDETDLATREMDRQARRQARIDRRERAEQYRREMREKYVGEPSAYVPTKQYGSFIVRPRCFERILVTSGCVNAHFPSSYTSAFAGLSLPPDVTVPLPELQPDLTTPWYNNELGS